MATPVQDREPTARSGTPGIPSRNEKLSRHKRLKRPIPATRREAEELYRPRSGNAPARADLLHRANRLGVLEAGTLTAGEVFERVMRAMYGDDGLLRLEPDE